MTTQSSTSSTNSARPQNNNSKVDGMASTPPCAQPAPPQNIVRSDDDPASQRSEAEPIEVSDSDEDVVEVIEDDEEELGECSSFF
jgi:hypothetical protein